MHHRLVTVAMSLCLVAACATASSRPTPASRRTRAAAAPLAGCEVVYVDIGRGSYGILCGKNFAVASRFTTDAEPAAWVSHQISGIASLLPGDLATARLPKPLTLAGAPRPATFMALFREPRHQGDRPWWGGSAAGWRTGPHRVLVVSCGGPLTRTAEAQCGALMRWMATHPALPRGLPKAPRDAIPEQPGWPGESVFPTPHGCQRRFVDDTRHLRLSCGGTELVVAKVHPIAAPPDPETLKSRMRTVGAETASWLRAQHVTGARTATPACRIGGHPGACRRYRYRANGHLQVLDVGVGELFHALVAISCHHPMDQEKLPPVCAKVMSLTPPPARTPPRPATP